MKILRLKTRGSIGFKKGLGLDSIDLDFSSLHGLVAFSGENGSSKSTCLELMHPYSRLVSRKGSLQTHFFLRDSFKRLDFEFQGNHYKTLIKIDAEGTRSPEGYIWKNHAEKSEVDSKISNYNRYITKLFGSPELFFASVFCSQGSKNLSDMTTGDLKKLFSEFLRLDKLIAYEDIAKQCNNLLASRASSLERDIESLKILAEGYAEVGVALSRTKADKEALEQNLLGLSKDLEKSEAEFTTVQADIQKNELIKTELAGLQDTVNHLSNEVESDQKQYDTEITDLRVKYQGIKADMSSVDRILADENKIRLAAAERDSLVASISRDKNTLAIASKDYFAASNNVTEKEAEALKISLKYEKLANAIDKNRDRLVSDIKHAQIRELTQKEIERSEYSREAKKDINESENEENRFKAKLETANLQVADLDKRDEKLIKAGEPECVSKACPFISTALSAQQDVPTLTRLIAEQAATSLKLKRAYSDTYNQLTVEIEALRKPDTKETPLRKQLTEESSKIIILEAEYTIDRDIVNADMETLKSKEFSLKAKKETIEADITKSETELIEIEDLAVKLPMVETALSRKQDLKERQTENIADGKKTKDFWEKRIIEKKGQKVIAETAWKKAEAEINMAAEENIGTIEQSISNLKTAITERTDEIADKAADIVKHEQEVARKEQAQKELTVKTTERGLAVNEASEWLYLKNACSAKGLRALEIDSVLPAIATYANDLLIRTFGTQYTVRFQTQDEETGREILDIIVIREDGSEVPIENLSGGQKVWLLSALRLSLTLISQEKSGKNFQTGFADESDGSLDVGHAIEYVQMYRAFMEVGGFENFYFISHKSETIALADHVLDFGNGKIAID
jgi:exonuclease SbcC